jgi:vacuolar-type H+-ATPase subunit H
MTKGSEDIKGHEHAAVQHAHKHEHSHSSHQDESFLSQVRALKGAENDAAKRLEDARHEASGIEAAARETAVEITAKAQEKAVEAKNEIMAKKRGETDSEIGSIVGAAKKQASAMRSKRLSETDVAEISQDI